MISSVSGYKPIINISKFGKVGLETGKNCSFCANSISLPKINSYTNVQTQLSEADKVKYTYLVNYLANVPVSPNSDNMNCNRQLDALLKNGRLLAKSNNDSSTTLDNLYDIATKERIYGLNQKKLISNTLDILCNPRTITQTFGDIPQDEKIKILQSIPIDDSIHQNPSLMDVTASGTCAAASNEVNLADKYPAEFARWVSKLSGKDEALYLDVKLSSLSKNKLEATTILDMLGANKSSFNFNSTRIAVNADKYVGYRAKIQDEHWDAGERNVADVLVQSAIMQLGSQNTYNSLTDTRAGEFNSNPQGLIEIEKTFVESLIKNKEITSLVYQKFDDNQNLIGYNCSFEKMEKHLKKAIDTGNDVIIGYVLTNETSGRTASQLYNPKTDGAPNKVINGHEITIVNYRTDEDGKTVFICIDTDDDSNNFVEYTSDWLLPKLHHAGYPAELVADDEKEIMKSVA